MSRCSVCNVLLPAAPEGECDGDMERCRKVCQRLHIGEYSDNLSLCTSCFVWLIGAYNDILIGRPFDPRAVGFLKLMRVDQEPLRASRAENVVSADTGTAPPQF